MGRALRTLLAVLHTGACSAFGIVAMGLRLVDGDWVMWNIGRRGWSVPLLKHVVGVSTEVHIHSDTAALAKSKQGLVLVANHTSLLDINAAFAASPTPIVFLGKAGIRKVPLLGKINELAGTIFVERGNRQSSEKAVKTLTQTLKDGRSVLVFPEGTRSKNGALKPFKKGAFHLAAQAGAPIVPMHISGTYSHLPPTAWAFQKSKEPIVVRLGAPLASTAQDVTATMEEAKSAVEALSAAE
jgi:1-acyl-sn-glycerol-3-phosphate acyltransferase